MPLRLRCFIIPPPACPLPPSIIARFFPTTRVFCHAMPVAASPCCYRATRPVRCLSVCRHAMTPRLSRSPAATTRPPRTACSPLYVVTSRRPSSPCLLIFDAAMPLCYAPCHLPDATTPFTSYCCHHCYFVSPAYAATPRCHAMPPPRHACLLRHHVAAFSPLRLTFFTPSCRRRRYARQPATCCCRRLFFVTTIHTLLCRCHCFLSAFGCANGHRTQQWHGDARLCAPHGEATTNMNRMLNRSYEKARGAVQRCAARQ